MDAFTEAMEDSNVKEFIDSSGITTMNISGEDAKEFMNRWQAVTSWILQDTGSAVVSPEEFGIERS